MKSSETWQQLAASGGFYRHLFNEHISVDMSGTQKKRVIIAGLIFHSLDASPMPNELYQSNKGYIKVL